jgi:hypothetical protein
LSYDAFGARQAAGLYACRTCLVFPDFRAPGDSFQRLYGAGLVEVQHGIELLRQFGMKVMADSFAGSPVDDSDCPFQAPLVELGAHPWRAPERHKKLRQTCLMKQRFEAAGQRRLDEHLFGGPIPLVSGRDSPAVRGEANQDGSLAVPLSR